MQYVPISIHFLKGKQKGIDLFRLCTVINSFIFCLGQRALICACQSTFFRLKHSAFFRLGIGNWTKTLNVDG